LATSVCEGCHGAEGRSTDPAIPIIAAQQQPYVELQLKAFRSESRDEPKGHELMRGVSSKWLLNDQIVAGIAEYFSLQPPAPGKPGDPAAMTKGKRLYEKGSFTPRIVPCSDCHGDNAQGIAIFPRLAGQHGEYLVRQMQIMRETLRDSRVMHGVIGELSDSEILAVATYLQSK
jgi:cytochrome c553